MDEPHYETCIHCGSHTGKAGADEDSIYLGTIGPFCEDCYDETGFYKLESELATLKKATDRFVAFMDEYYSIRGIVIPVNKSDMPEDRILKEIYFTLLDAK